jgi:cytoskeletal protein CcmA (bactofilin family)
MQESSPSQRSAGIPAGVRITGEVVAAEDLDIHGQVDGQVTAPDHHVTVGATGTVTAKIIARVVTLAGHLDGTVTAGERVRILESATVTGHLHTPSLVLADGALFNGTADPERTEAAMHVARYRQKQQE